MHYELALLVGGSHDGEQVQTYPGQYRVRALRAAEAVSSCTDPAAAVSVDDYVLHRVHDSAGFHRIIGLLEGDHRGPMQALYEGYKKENANV